jgi:uncharacterized protein (TIGR03067 family)
MRANVLFAILFGVWFPAGKPADDASKKDLEKMQGNWVMQSSERDGRKMPAAQLKNFTRTVKGDSYTVAIEDEQGGRDLGGTVTLDPSQNPKAIDAHMTDGPMKGKTMLGIYKFDSDTQTVCYAAPGLKRPTAFDSTQGTLTVWKRDKKRSPSSTRESAAPSGVDSLRQIVEQCNRKSIEDFRKGDMLAVARGYADDATIYFPRGKKVQGREAIDRYWQQVKGAKDWKLEALEVGGTGEAIYEVGKSTLVTEVDGKEIPYVCDYVVIWKRQKDGTYLAHTDIFN